MRRVVLANETDWEGWRKATRSLVLAGVAPDQVRWAVRSHDEEGDPLQEEAGSFGISRALVSLAALAIQARDPERFPALPAGLARACRRARAGAERRRRCPPRARPRVRGARRGAQDAHAGAIPARHRRQSHALSRLVRAGALRAGGQCAADGAALCRLHLL